jgi:peroxiredoxin
VFAGRGPFNSFPQRKEELDAKLDGMAGWVVIDDGVVTHVFYPVFPPDRSAAEVVEWLSRNN